MNRLVIPLAVLVLAGGVYFLLSYRPQGGHVEAPAPATEAPAPAITDAEVPLAPRRVEPPSVPSIGPLTAAPAAVESGPFEVVMGEYKIALRDSQKRMRMTLVLTTDNPVTRQEIRNRRDQLRRMIYFLSAHRTEESMVGDAGRDRFLKDLAERFANVIRTGNLDKLEMTTWVLEDAPVAPASDGDPK